MKRYIKFVLILMFAVLSVNIFLPIQKEDNNEVSKTQAVTASGLWSDFASSSFSAGDGTKENPYIIDSAEKLSLMSKKINDGLLTSSSFKIVSDIDLQGHNWVPIAEFKGTLDGFGYNIKNLTIIDQKFYSEMYPNLRTVYCFIDVLKEAALVKNLNFTNVNFINNQTNVSVEAMSLFQASTDNAKIENIHILSGNYINNENDAVRTIAPLVSNDGGFVKNESTPELCYTLINNCSSNINIKDTGKAVYSVGGLVGFSRGTITNSYCYGSIETNSSHFLGGFAGQLYSLGIIKNCFSKTNIRTTTSIDGNFGGLVGHLGAGGVSRVESAYYNGNFTSLYGVTDNFYQENVYININSLKDLPTDVWAVDSKINDGDPFLIDRYWEKSKS